MGETGIKTIARELFAFLVGTLLVSAYAWGVSAAPIEITLYQSDGTPFLARPAGSEFVNWMETLDGHPIVQQGGDWYYAVEDVDGNLAAGPAKVGSLNPAELAAMPKNIRPVADHSTLDTAVPRSLARGFTKSLVHTQNIVTILVDFTDISFTYSDASFESLIFGATDSVKEFFLENTYNNFVVAPAADSYGTANDGIVHIAMGSAHPNLGSGDWRATAASIIAAADGHIDYSAFDTDASGSISAAELSVVIILAGYENSFGGAGAPTPRVWGHKSSLSSPLSLDGVTLQPYTMFGERHSGHQATIGIMCHELGHLMLGLPDLYDINGGSEGIGDWGLMGSGSWNSVGTYSGETPAHLSAWSKARLDITTPTDVDAAAVGTSLLSAHGNADIKRLWIDKYKSPIGEYFLVENRQQSGYDAGLPGNGLMIWHVDDSRTSNSDENHKWVDVEAADGQTHLDAEVNEGDAGDTFPGSSNNTTFNDASTPNSNDYTPAATGIAVTNISASAASMTADFTPRSGGVGDHLAYDEKGYTGSRVGYGNPVVWTAVRFTNNTSLETLDGFEVYTLGSTTVDFYLYTSIPSGTPSGLIHSESGFAASAGWNRFLLSTPQSFPAGADRVMVLRIESSGATHPAYYDNAGVNSERTYVDSNGSGTFLQLTVASGYGDLNQHVLLSGDTTGPTVSAITPTTTSPTNSDTVSFDVTFDEDVQNFDAEADLIITELGTVGHTGVSFGGGPVTYSVDITGVTGDGTLNLAVDVNSDVQDLAGNALTTTVTSNDVTLDNTAPYVDSVTGQSGTTIDVAFSEAMGASAEVAGNYTLSGSGQGSLNSGPNSVIDQGGNVYRLSWSSGEMFNGGDLTVTVANVQDSAGNTIGAPSSGTDVGAGIGTAPAVNSITRGTPAQQNTNASQVTFAVEFSEAVSGVGPGNFSVDGTDDQTGATVLGVSGSGVNWDVTVTTAAGEGDLSIDLDTSLAAITDAAGHALSAAFTGGESYTIDRVAPSVTGITRMAPVTMNTNAASVDFAVTLGEAVTGLAANNFSLDASGAQTGASITGVSGSGQNWTVSVGTAAGDGTLSIDLNMNLAGVTDDFGNAVGAYTAGEFFNIDRTLPAVSSIARMTPAAELTNATQVTFAVTFTESVLGVAANNFNIDGTGTQASAAINTVNGLGQNWTVTVDTAAGDGALGIDCDQNLSGITDGVGNAVSGAYSAGETYDVDRTAPQADTVAALTGSPTGASTIEFSVTFSEDVNGFNDVNDLVLTPSGTIAYLATSITGGPQTYSVEVVGVHGAGTLTLVVDTGSNVADAASNNLSSSAVSSAVSIDTTLLHYVDFAFAGTEIGSADNPYNTLLEAVTALSDGGEIRLRGDTADNSTDEVLTLSKPMTLTSEGGPVRIGEPAAKALSPAETGGRWDRLKSRPLWRVLRAVRDWWENGEGPLRDRLK